MLLFLDFDGVTHERPTTHTFVARFMPEQRGAEVAGLFSHRPLLWKLLREYLDLEVVFSTSWRERHDLKDLVSLSTQGGGEDLAHRFIDVLPVIEVRNAEDLPNLRYREIQQYLRESGRQAEPWIALDDDPALFPANCQNLILCDDGFSEKESNEVREKLARCASDAGDKPESEFPGDPA